MVRKGFWELKRIGRPRGSGSYESQDEPHIQKMRALVLSGEATSAHDAARIVAPEAKGKRGASEESIKRRLHRRYLKRFPE